MAVTTTTADAVRDALAAQIQTIVPRYAARQSERWTWTRDQEVAGTLRNFDVLMDAEEEVPEGAYGGGLEYASETEIRVAYPVSGPDLPRFMGADAQDLAAILVRLHTSIPGMFPVSMRAELPILDKSSTGSNGAYVVSYRTSLHFFVVDTVVTS